MIFKYCKSFILIISVILKKGHWSRRKCEVCCEFLFRKVDLCYQAILINFVTILICDKNLTSDKFVSVSKFQVLGKREYLGVYLDVLQVLRIWKTSFCFHFLSKSSSEGEGEDVGLRGESPHRVIMLGSESRTTVN